ncbi:hypothetical protein AAIG86_30200, partial [Pseudomonas aeruginosa]
VVGSREMPQKVFSFVSDAFWDFRSYTDIFEKCSGLYDVAAALVWQSHFHLLCVSRDWLREKYTRYL